MAGNQESPDKQDGSTVVDGSLIGRKTKGGDPAGQVPLVNQDSSKPQELEINATGRQHELSVGKAQFFQQEKKSARKDVGEPVLSFLDGFIRKKPFGNNAPQIWGTEKINEFLEQATKKEIQNLCREIIDKNNYFVSLIGIQEMQQLWEIFWENMKEVASASTVNDKILSLEIHITVLNTLYKNISTHSSGLGLNTFLNYRVIKQHIKPAILQILKKDGGTYIKCSLWEVRVDKHTSPEENKVIINIKNVLYYIITT